jgi:hypothetical protein
MKPMPVPTKRPIKNPISTVSSATWSLPLGLRAVVAQLAEEEVSREDLQSLVGLEARLRDLLPQALRGSEQFSKTVLIFLKVALCDASIS